MKTLIATVAATLSLTSCASMPADQVELSRTNQVTGQPQTISEIIAEVNARPVQQTEVTQHKDGSVSFEAKGQNHLPKKGK